MLGITLGVTYRINPGFDKLLGRVLSVVSFGETWVGNIAISGPVEGYPLVNSEGNMVVNK